MKLIIHRNPLNEALKSASAAVANKSTLPVLEMFHLKAEDNLLTIGANNLEFSIGRLVLAYKLSEPGEICVPAKLLLSLVATLSEELVTLESTSLETLKVSCGSVRTTIKGLPGAEFPPVPAHFNEGISLPAQEWRQALHSVLFAASTEEARPTLQGVHINGALACTDGFRVAMCKIEGNIKGLISAKAAAQLVKLISSEEETVVARQMESSLQFAGTGWVLQSQLIDGNFPDYKNLLPKSYKTSAVVDRKTMILATKQVALFDRVLEVKILGNQVLLSSASEEVGDGQVVMNANAVNGPELTFYVNSHFWLDAMEAATSDEIEIKSNDKKSPILVAAPGSDAWHVVQMPIFKG